MLTRVIHRPGKKKGGRFAIVASRYNDRYVAAMLRAARSVLNRAGVEEVKIVRVPGAFEIPVAVARLTRGAARPFSAVICLGVILRGETAHAQHIGQAVSHALAQIQIQSGVPVIHEVLLLDNEAQARVRCLGGKHNRGSEAAYTALEMARTLGELDENAAG